VILLALALVAALRPEWVAVPFAVVSGWLAASLFIRAYRLRPGKDRGSGGSPRVTRDPPRDDD
jgi:hypothetical protein